MHKTEMKEIREFIDGLNIEEDAWCQMADRYVEECMIQGEETTKLEQILNRAPESLLDLILNNWEKETEDFASRKKKEQFIYELIVESFQEEFIFLDEDDIELMLKAMNGHPLSAMQMADLQQIYCDKGWVFMFYRDNECSFVVPDEIRETMIENLEDEKVTSKMMVIAGLRFTLHACVNLYGVVEKKTVLQIALGKMFEDSDASRDGQEESRQLYEIAEEILQTLCQREEGAFWEDGEWIISDEFEDRKQYKQFLRQVSGQEYYIPSSEEIYLYKENMVDIENPYYKKLFKDLTRLMKDKIRADNLMLELEYMAAQQDFTVQDIMNLLFARKIVFPSERNEENFAENCSQWLSTVRKWSNRGFTDKELGRKKADIKVIMAPEQIVKTTQISKPQKKIGRNDPCPCGSGKKYKKCCGK